MTFVGVFLDGLQEEGVAGNPLHRHHQVESQRGGVYFRPGEMNGNNEKSELQDRNHQPLHVRFIVLFFYLMF